jgi:hypothetical protein
MNRVLNFLLFLFPLFVAIAYGCQEFPVLFRVYGEWYIVFIVLGSWLALTVACFAAVMFAREGIRLAFVQMILFTAMTLANIFQGGYSISVTPFYSSTQVASLVFWILANLTGIFCTIVAFRNAKELRSGGNSSPYSLSKLSIVWMALALVGVILLCAAIGVNSDYQTNLSIFVYLSGMLNTVAMGTPFIFTTVQLCINDFRGQQLNALVLMSGPYSAAWFIVVVGDLGNIIAENGVGGYENYVTANYLSLVAAVFFLAASLGHTVVYTIRANAYKREGAGGIGIDETARLYTSTAAPPSYDAAPSSYPAAPGNVNVEFSKDAPPVTYQYQASGK